jgi:hypothetical protein
MPFYIQLMLLFALRYSLIVLYIYKLISEYKVLQTFLYYCINYLVQ